MFDDTLIGALSERDRTGFRAAAIGLLAASHTLASARNASPLPDHLADLAATLDRVAERDADLDGFIVYAELDAALALLDAEMAPGARTWPPAQRRHADKTRALLVNTVQRLSPASAA